MIGEEPEGGAYVYKTSEEAVKFAIKGREFYESIGSPKFILAPMVDQSELAWRLLCLRNGADACYSPMLHSRLFLQEKYQNREFSTNKDDKPLFIQFCGNDPTILLDAAKIVQKKCVAIDLNLGCPQGIARKGHYGAYLMDQWDLIGEIIEQLGNNLIVPICVKIRIFPDKYKTLEYANCLLSAGASILAVHCRTRDQKGQNTGSGDWSQVKFLVDNLPKQTVIFANGNIFSYQDMMRCIKETGCDAILTAEGALCNPKIFLDPEKQSWKSRHPMITDLVEEYFDVIKKYNLENDHSTLIAIKSHLFKILHKFFVYNVDVRDTLTNIHGKDIQIYDHLRKALAYRIIELNENNTINESTDVLGEVDKDLGYPQVPFWRAQCCKRF